MAGVDGVPAYVWGPAAPNLERIAVELLEVVVAGPEDERRALDDPAVLAVGIVVRSVDPEAGAVVLEHRVHRLGIAGCVAELGVVLRSHREGVAVVPCIRVRTDDPLGNRR